MVEEEKFEYGSHNFYAPSLEPIHYLPYFPWADYFALAGFAGQYPALLYEDEAADRLFEQTSERLASLQEQGLQTPVQFTFVDTPGQAFPTGELLFAFVGAQEPLLTAVTNDQLFALLSVAVCGFITKEACFGLPVRLQPVAPQALHTPPAKFFYKEAEVPGQGGGAEALPQALYAFSVTVQ